MQIFLYIAIIILFPAPVPALGEQPLDALQRGIDKGMSVLVDPQYQDPSRRQEQEQKLWEITQEFFDFTEFSRQVLASHWKKFTSPQRKEFINLTSELLGKLNMRKLQTRYNGEKVFFINQKIINESRALVEINVLWKNLEFPVTLRMKKSHGKWKIYDLTVFGVSSVGNYRAQIHQIMQEKSPEEMIELIKEKIREKEKKIEIEENA